MPISIFSLFIMTALTIGSEIMHGEKDRSGGQDVVGISLNIHVEITAVFGLDLILLQTQ